MFAVLDTLAKQAAERFGRLAVTVVHGSTRFSTYVFDTGNTLNQLEGATLAPRSEHLFKICSVGITFDIRPLDTIEVGTARWQVLSATPSPSVEGSVLFFTVKAVQL